MIDRDARPHLLRLAELYSVVAVFGPRQSGKTTLCQQAFPKHDYVNLEAEDARSYAQQDPRDFLRAHSGGVILDEVQNVPELFGYVQEEVDRERCPGRFVLTGSLHFALSERISQSLAGRVGILQLLPLSLNELRRFPDAPTDLLEVLWHGGYPRIFNEGLPADQWLRDYFTTYIQRDVRQVMNVGDLNSFSTFVRLLAGSTSCELNLSRLGTDTGVSHHTARSWLSVLETSLLICRISPFFANIRKQLVKSPKIHYLDSGLVCYLLGIRTAEELRHHPLRGAIFESWVVSELIKHRAHGNRELRLHHFRVNRGVEVDLIVDDGQLLRAIELKSGTTMQDDFLAPLEQLGRLFEKDARTLEQFLVYGGEEQQKRRGITVLPWSAAASSLDSRDH